jgi:hypothetical protein
MQLLSQASFRRITAPLPMFGPPDILKSESMKRPGTPLQCGHRADTTHHEQLFRPSTKWEIRNELVAGDLRITLSREEVKVVT